MLGNRFGGFLDTYFHITVRLLLLLLLLLPLLRMLAGWMVVLLWLGLLEIKFT